MPRADGETVLNIHRREFYQVAHARGPGRLCGHLVLNWNLRPGVNQEQLVDSAKGRLQACGLFEITDGDFNTISEKRAGLLDVAHEYTRPAAALQQMIDHPGSYISRRSGDEIGHKTPWQQQNMFCRS